MKTPQLDSIASFIPEGLDRRTFLTVSALAAAKAATLGVFASPAGASGTRKIVTEEPWGRIEALGDDVWAVVSTPLAARDFTTVCNGGIIAGSDRVLVVESFGSPAGGRWVSEQAKQLTGRYPTDIVISHFHGDHANGVEGFQIDDHKPSVWRTDKTQTLIDETDLSRKVEASEVRQQMLEGGKTIVEEETTKVDLGGRTVTLHPRGGHTPSDVTVEIDDPAISFGGDLVWNGFFPNYRDTIPTEFATSLRQLRRDDGALYVSGHGEIADLRTVDLLIEITDGIGELAKQSHAKGMRAAEAAAQFKLPESAESWVLFSPNYFEVAMNAWYRELG